MNLITIVYVFSLFYVLLPGNVIKIPIKMSKIGHVLLHAFLFSIIMLFTYSYIENIELYESMECITHNTLQTCSPPPVPES